MKLLTWNIQCGTGVDGRVDLARVVDCARGFADFDILCLQEVARNYPRLTNGDATDQFAVLAALLPEFHAVEGIAVDRHTPGAGRQQFGNMILTRFEPAQVLRHQLPWPADSGVPSMPRMALEAVLAVPGGPLRVTTTHLEFNSALQRAAQIETLRAIQSDAAGHAADLARPERVGKPYETRPRSARGVLTGDFNCPPDDPLVARLQAPIDDRTPAYCDAWTLLNPGRPHPPTVGVHDKVQWKDKEMCFDYVFVSADIAAHARTIAVEMRIDASDHQPVLIEIDL